MIELDNEEYIEDIDWFLDIIEEKYSPSISIVGSALEMAVQVIAKPAMINIDVCDLKEMSRNEAPLQIGYAESEENCGEAVQKCMESTVTSGLGTESLNGCAFLCSGNISLPEVDDALMVLQDIVGEEVNLIFGMTYEETDTYKAAIFCW